MHTLFLICAVAGGTILVIQVILLLVGFDGSDSDVDVAADADIDVDVDVDMDSGEYHVDSGEGASGQAALGSFTVISTKTLTAFVAFFGLGGLLAQNYGWENHWTLAMAIGGGLAALYLVAYLWMLMNRLQSAGNVNVRNAVGTVGRVYLKIPAKSEGHGKVTISVQGRTLELSATTGGDEIPTGAEVRVVGLVGDKTLKVLPVEGSKE